MSHKKMSSFLRLIWMQPVSAMKIKTTFKIKAAILTEMTFYVEMQDIGRNPFASLTSFPLGDWSHIQGTEKLRKREPGSKVKTFSRLRQQNNKTPNWQKKVNFGVLLWSTIQVAQIGRRFIAIGHYFVFIIRRNLVFLPSAC